MPQVGFNQNIYREVLDEDRRIYKEAFSMELKNQSRFDEMASPQNREINIDILNKVQLVTDNLIKELQQVIGDGAVFFNKKGSDPLASSNDALKFYNQLVTLIQTPQLEQQSKRMAEAKAHELLPLLRTVIDNYKVIISTKLYHDKNDHNLPLFVMQYAMYKLMQNRIDGGNFNVITYGDLTNEFKNAVQRDYRALGGDEQIMRFLNNEFKHNAIEQNFDRGAVGALDPEEQMELFNQYKLQPATSSAYSNRLNPYELESSVNNSLDNPFLRPVVIMDKEGKEKKNKKIKKKEEGYLPPQAKVEVPPMTPEDEEYEDIKDEEEEKPPEKKKKSKKDKNPEESEKKSKKEEIIVEPDTKKKSRKDETKSERSERMKKVREARTINDRERRKRMNEEIEKRLEAQKRKEEEVIPPPPPPTPPPTPPPEGSGKKSRKFYMKQKAPALQYRENENESYFY